MLYCTLKVTIFASFNGSILENPEIVPHQINTVQNKVYLSEIIESLSEKKSKIIKSNFQWNEEDEKIQLFFAVIAFL